MTLDNLFTMRNKKNKINMLRMHMNNSPDPIACWYCLFCSFLHKTLFKLKLSAQRCNIIASPTVHHSGSERRKIVSIVRRSSVFNFQWHIAISFYIYSGIESIFLSIYYMCIHTVLYLLKLTWFCIFPLLHCWSHQERFPRQETHPKNGATSRWFSR